MIGIYKITSPSNKIYIGQSINIEKRYYIYSLKSCKTQIKLYHSFLKYGFNNHMFQILEECEESELNNRERYYQDLYNSTGKNGLNCRLTETNDKSGKLSEETIEKMKISQKRNIKKLSSMSKEVIDLNTMIIYPSVKKVAENFNISSSNLSRKLKGTRKNKTSFKYYKEYINECNKIINLIK
jgi:hypothetical protein